MYKCVCVYANICINTCVLVCIYVCVDALAPSVGSCDICDGVGGNGLVVYLYFLYIFIICTYKIHLSLYKEIEKNNNTKISFQ